MIATIFLLVKIKIPPGHLLLYRAPNLGPRAYLVGKSTSPKIADTKVSGF